jgi:hypothetical protein
MATAGLLEALQVVAYRNDFNVLGLKWGHNLPLRLIGFFQSCSHLTQQKALAVNASRQQVTLSLSSQRKDATIFSRHETDLAGSDQAGWTAGRDASHASSHTGLHGSLIGRITQDDRRNPWTRDVSRDRSLCAPSASSRQAGGGSRDGRHFCGSRRKGQCQCTGKIRGI